MMLVLTKADLLSNADENGDNEDDDDNKLVTYRKVRDAKV